MRNVYVCLMGCALILGVAGCKSSSSGGPVAGVIERTGASADASSSAQNQPPLSIGGSAPPAAKVGEEYSFRPVLAALSTRGHTFTVNNLPPWLAFNKATGEVSGMPQEEHVGVYPAISISVFDGFRTGKLAPFDIEVVAEGDRSVELAWYPPDENVDGSPVFDLAGYTIRYGRQSGQVTRTIDISNPSTTSYLIKGLIAGTYYFTLSAYNSLGISSETSDEIALALP